MSRNLITIIIFILLILSTNIAAVGIGVTPAGLEFELCANESISKTLQIINTGEKKAGYSLYSDDTIACLSIIPEKFQLGSKESMTVNITVTNPGLEGYLTKISVVAVNPSAWVSIGTGIKIPVNISVIETKNVVVEETVETPPSFIGNVIAFVGSSNSLISSITLLSLVLLVIIPRVRSARKQKGPESSSEKKKNGLRHI